MPLILASASPRRQAFLRAGNVQFTVQPADIDESQFNAAGHPEAVALATAQAKAAEIARRLLAAADAPEPGTLIVAADTIVVVGDGPPREIFGKPTDREHARAMLMRLSGRTHEVVTALVLQPLGAPGEPLPAALAEPVPAGVTFNRLTPELVDAYLASGEADDKAGAYGIQGLGARLVSHVSGDLTTVIGLPLARLTAFYEELTGQALFGKLTPREIALRAYPDLTTLPAQCLEGIPG